MKKLYSIVLLLNLCVFAYSQNTIQGTFSDFANQELKLVGYTGFDTYIIDTVHADKKGEFTVSFSKENHGMGYLLSEDEKSFVVILAENENLQLKGETFALPETIVIVNGIQNQLFEQYASEHPRREQTLSAWDYLTNIYRKDSLFTVQELPKKAIEKEKQRIKAEDRLFLESLPEGSYVSWYLPIRKLVSSVSTLAQHRTEEIPAALDAFRTIDYTDARLYKSGLLKETLDSHFWLIENGGPSLDHVYKEMNTSIDRLIENLLADEQKLNEISAYLFKLLEKRSLVKASEYLAVRLLNEKTCTLDDDFAAQLESYRAMKIGNTAPQIVFEGTILAPGYDPGDVPKRLSAIKSDYLVVVFGASWCPSCPSELAQIAGLYNTWSSQNVEVVFVSLDEEKETFEKFASPFPFISICDYQKWESPGVKDYHVFATPTMYLLDNQREIVLRPTSVSQIDAWVDWYLVQGNK